MAINFTRLFTTLGKLCGALNEVNTYRATTLAGRLSTIITQFGTTAAYGPSVSGLYDAIDSAKGAENAYCAYLGQLAEDVIIAEVKADRPLTAESLSSALAELVRQMVVAAETLNDCPGTVTVASVGSPTGDHAFVFGTYDVITGTITDYLIPDVYLIQCSADRSQGGTAYAETFSVVGKPADDLPTDSTYPSGTGLDTTTTAIDPSTDGGVVTEGSFDGTWTGTGNSTPPSPWAVFGSTVANTHVFRSNSSPRGTGYSLHLLGDGSVVVKVRQPITVTARTAYAVHARVYDVTDPGTDWAVSLILTDSTGATVTGNGSYANVVSSAAAGSLATSWANTITGQFCTPDVLPTGGCYLEIRLHQSGALTTAAANTAAAYVDFVSVQEVEPLYAGGPVMAAFSGITEGVVGDARTATVALSSGAPSAYLIRGIDRLLSGGLASAAVRIPTLTGGSETQADSLVS